MKLAWPLLMTLLCSCASGEQVTRRRGDVTEVGRKISSLAYTWYARGVYHESQSDRDRAELSYRAAINHDEKSGAAWAALGRVLCSQPQSSSQPQRAAEVFSLGLRKAERRAPIYLEKSRCRLEQASTRAAANIKAPRPTKHHHLCSDAERALEIEPDNPAVSRFLVKCFEYTGELEKAARYERAASLYLGEPLVVGSEADLDAIDSALREGDLRKARSHALDLILPGQLAVRAAFWGKNDLAREQAELVLAAAPDNADALVTLIYLGDFPSDVGPPQHLSAAGVLLFATVLRRTASEKVARSFVAEHAALLAGSPDPLVTTSRQLWEKPPLAQ